MAIMEISDLGFTERLESDSFVSDSSDHKITDVVGGTSRRIRWPHNDQPQQEPTTIVSIPIKLPFCPLFLFPDGTIGHKCFDTDDSH
ncbi:MULTISPECIES: hypothetical protein [Moorena]|uniref:Uncharacterized protein n=2 Tax=Moorena TaxID=1155738 RepID=F4XJ45_9CYAN|nr:MULTISPECIES: hypothetical protein [Moorena]NES87696.1 hypothetical protein [Moorena sp. SIO2B7]EGJ35387.1 hypothetical protein LYNGBM3L_05700 [Moorena producens 3L]NER86404.1 hypothetical protein [Moorena sp. SIO3A2]NES44233.1 hypothetical protein [Moorena sp. SIO2C4]OLT64035.1 hypothetical protein BI334_02420 [Moorena producens 3L]